MKIRDWSPEYVDNNLKTTIEPSLGHNNRKLKHNWTRGNISAKLHYISRLKATLLNIP